VGLFLWEKTMGIESYSTTPLSNSSAPPHGAPEGMGPSQVNDVMRQIMADVRAHAEDGGWLDWGHTPTYVAADKFSVPGDQTAVYTVGRRVRIADNGTKYGTITDSSYTSLTTVTVTLDSGSLSSPSVVALGVDAGAIASEHTHTLSDITDAKDWAKKDPATDSKSADYTIVATDNGKLIKVDATGEARTILLPAAATAGNGFSVTIKKTDASENTVTIDGDSSETIDGAETFVLAAQNDAVELRCDGTGWQVVGESSAPPANSVFTESYDSGDQTITSGGSLTLAHGLSSQPKLYKSFIKCVTAEHDYSVGDEIEVAHLQEGGSTSANRAVVLVPDATNVFARIGSDGLIVVHKSTGNRQNMTNANWRLIVRAWA
jgi:hypothetical protein